jgi:hypothetical protein
MNAPKEERPGCQTEAHKRLSNLNNTSTGLPVNSGYVTIAAPTSNAFLVHPGALVSPAFGQKGRAEVTTVWHYTVGIKMPLIRESGVLLPTDSGIEPDELPVLWFSTNPYFEPTSAKAVLLASEDPEITELTLHWLSMQENAQPAFSCTSSTLPYHE